MEGVNLVTNEKQKKNLEGWDDHPSYGGLQGESPLRMFCFDECASATATPRKGGHAQTSTALAPPPMSLRLAAEDQAQTPSPERHAPLRLPRVGRGRRGGGEADG
jgi:hypothetical protein